MQRAYWRFYGSDPVSQDGPPPVWLMLVRAMQNERVNKVAEMIVQTALVAKSKDIEEFLFTPKDDVDAAKSWLENAVYKEDRPVTSWPSRDALEQVLVHEIMDLEGFGWTINYLRQKWIRNVPSVQQHTAEFMAVYWSVAHEFQNPGASLDDVFDAYEEMVASTNRRGDEMILEEGFEGMLPLMSREQFETLLANRRVTPHDFSNTALFMVALALFADYEVLKRYDGRPLGLKPYYYRQIMEDHGKVRNANGLEECAAKYLSSNTVSRPHFVFLQAAAQRAGVLITSEEDELLSSYRSSGELDERLKQFTESHRDLAAGPGPDVADDWEDTSWPVFVRRLKFLLTLSSQIGFYEYNLSDDEMYSEEARALFGAKLSVWWKQAGLFESQVVAVEAVEKKVLERLQKIMARCTRNALHTVDMIVDKLLVVACSVQMIDPHVSEQFLMDALCQGQGDETQRFIRNDLYAILHNIKALPSLVWQTARTHYLRECVVLGERLTNVSGYSEFMNVAHFAGSLNTSQAEFEESLVDEVDDKCSVLEEEGEHASEAARDTLTMRLLCAQVKRVLLSPSHEADKEGLFNELFIPDETQSAAFSNFLSSFAMSSWLPMARKYVADLFGRVNAFIGGETLSPALILRHDYQPGAVTTRLLQNRRGWGQNVFALSENVYESLTAPSRGRSKYQYVDQARFWGLGLWFGIEGASLHSALLVKALDFYDAYLANPQATDFRLLDSLSERKRLLDLARLLHPYEFQFSYAHAFGRMFSEFETVQSWYDSVKDQIEFSRPSVMDFIRSNVGHPHDFGLKNELMEAAMVYLNRGIPVDAAQAGAGPPDDMPDGTTEVYTLLWPALLLHGISALFGEYHKVFISAVDYDLVVKADANVLVSTYDGPGRERFSDARILQKLRLSPIETKDRHELLKQAGFDYPTLLQKFVVRYVDAFLDKFFKDRQEDENESESPPKRLDDGGETGV
jgi:hypothetical protein